jgi:hypothetical protein
MSRSEERRKTISELFGDDHPFLLADAPEF